MNVGKVSSIFIFLVWPPSSLCRWWLGLFNLVLDDNTISNKTKQKKCKKDKTIQKCRNTKCKMGRRHIWLQIQLWPTFKFANSYSQFMAKHLNSTKLAKLSNVTSSNVIVPKYSGEFFSEILIRFWSRLVLKHIAMSTFIVGPLYLKSEFVWQLHK